MKPVLIFGAGQVAEVFARSLETNGYFVAAHVVDAGFVPISFYGKPIIFLDQALDLAAPDVSTFAIGMSFKTLNAPRAAKFDAMRLKGYEPLTFVDKRASVDETAKIGAGSFIMDENTVQPYTEIGENTILWSGNHVGHHTKIGNHVFVASHAVISGAVEIGDYSFIGVNATISDGVKIGKRCIIGAGALILSDCEDDGVYSPGGTERSRVPSSRIRI